MVRKILRHEAIGSAQLSVVFVTDQRMKSLNQKYLRHSFSTDVLAFDFRSSSEKKKDQPVKELNAEIVISTAAACRQAKIFGSTPDREIALYLIHGILHLLGFDDHRKVDIKRIRREEEKLMDLIK
jgi:probable rRNA maturation factor